MHCDMVYAVIVTIHGEGVGQKWHKPEMLCWENLPVLATHTLNVAPGLLNDNSITVRFWYSWVIRFASVIPFKF